MSVSKPTGSNHSLSGKIVFITGGSRGIGAAIARAFAAVGAHVAISYRRDQAAADAIICDLRSMGVEAMAVAGDIANPADALAMVDKVVTRFGHVDVLINNAGVLEYRVFEKADIKQFRTIFDINVFGVIAMIQAALPHISAPGGRIINFSSGLASRPIPTTSIYAASKAAVEALSHALAKEFAPRGITVNTIAPGLIETDMTADFIAENRERATALIPLGRIGQPDDISGIALFLASHEAKWLTGRVLIADGGVS